MIVAWGTARRAWRRSLQLRMVAITLLVSGVLVGGFGTLVASRITTGMVNAKVNSGLHQVQEAAQRVAPQLGGVTDAADPSLPGLVRLVAQTLTPTTSQDSQVFVAILPATPRIPTSAQQVVPPVSGVADVISPKLRQLVADGNVAHQFVQASFDRGGPHQYLVVGSPIRLSFGRFGLYYLFPLGAEQDAANLVQTTVIATGLALVLLLAVLAALTTRLVVRPVRLAARTAQRLSAGLLDQRMEVHGEDDLALLAASFNQMAQNLQRQIIRLEEMSRLQRRFTSDVSHELRTPLTTVRMAADLIFNSRAGFEPAVARSAELLQAELNRFEDLLTDLLEISRFDAGFAVLDAEPTDLVPIVSHVTERLAAFAGRCGVTLELRVPETGVIAEVDPRRVERILRNLIGNAVEHGERRPVQVRLAADENAIAIAVRDHGIGLQDGEAKQVFNRFWRADPSRARQTGGTGLGLSISLEDARLHGGWLEAWGAPGRGAQFRLTLPVQAGDRLVASPLPLVPDDADAVPTETAEPALTGDGHG
ncbi:MAG: two-component sensor histidine kinase [Actinobacteria bacterium 13_2_20CM_2_71_6]|nr:MAG: two-component sensor histidine kinase [Actinobacteria bacterium 13_2_20CM_2_71_6]